jgi:hypothetical protein
MFICVSQEVLEMCNLTGLREAGTLTYVVTRLFGSIHLLCDRKPSCFVNFETHRTQPCAG